MRELAGLPQQLAQFRMQDGSVKLGVDAPSFSLLIVWRALHTDLVHLSRELRTQPASVVPLAMHIPKRELPYHATGSSCSSCCTNGMAGMRMEQSS